MLLTKQRKVYRIPNGVLKSKLEAYILYTKDWATLAGVADYIIALCFLCFFAQRQFQKVTVRSCLRKNQPEQLILLQLHVGLGKS